jgi:flagellar hook assembly protein FlgD
MDLRREADAVEARKRDEDEVPEEGDEEEGDEEEEEDEEDEGEGEAEASDDSDDDDGGDDDDEDAPKKKKKPKKVAAKKPAVKRTRAVKEVRQRAVWVVFDNGRKVVKTFPFNQKAEAEKLLAEKLEEKKGTFYINLVKEEIKD